MPQIAIHRRRMSMDTHSDLESSSAVVVGGVKLRHVELRSQEVATADEGDMRCASQIESCGERNVHDGDGASREDRGSLRGGQDLLRPPPRELPWVSSRRFQFQNCCKSGASRASPGVVLEVSYRFLIVF